MEHDPTHEHDPNLDANQEAPEDRTDWKAKAIAAETELRLRQQQNQPAPAAQAPNPLQAAEQELAQLRESMPALDRNNPASFWEREEHKAKLDAARERVAEMRERDRMRQVQAIQYQTQAQKVASEVKSRFKDRPGFAKAEAEFDKRFASMRPEAQADPGTVSVLMKTVLFDVMGSSTGTPTPPTPAGASGYRPGVSGPKGGKGQPMEFKSEAEARVAAIYGMTAEEYYSPKYNEAGEHTQGNGVSIYPFPIGGNR